MSAVANPLINITIQGRNDTYPKRRGMTRVPELMAAGVPVAFGHDCVMDPWYSLGSGDMLEVAAMGTARRADDRPGGHARVLTPSPSMPRRSCISTGYGIAPGNRADFVLCGRAIRSKRSACAPRARGVPRRADSSRRRRRPPYRCVSRGRARIVDWTLR